ncbi:fasciclin domain-containing protein [Methanoculleus sp. Wushi-C6]|uniref:Fasciclin domain-containing protein n=1 Tax=Methanoculleus caldifontis TaxID=2651577 RepID=A0ABU3X355_9EURY|nr:fasciclin domain-containing protein [Methanoculleus sp. Wushi-C6]MDV2482482.1 fasciclin domain-containing protein [Methanoculleus sp. Wushi-C6]
MRRWTVLCACILVLLAMPFAVTAAVVGDGNETVTPAGETGQMGPQTANMTIAAYIAQDQNLTRLYEAIIVADLYDTLNTAGPYTVFAPSNEAFDALGTDTFNQLATDTENLTMLLQYHVVDGEYTAENLTNMTQNETGEEENGGILDIFGGLLGGGEEEENMTALDTLSGESLNVTMEDNETLMIENATVTRADIYATNGVIHIIDQVLVPPGLNLTAVENQTADGVVTPQEPATPVEEPATPIQEPATPVQEPAAPGQEPATPVMGVPI